jgi:hypothetical protein
MQYQLVNDKTNEPINIGDTVTTFRGEEGKLIYVDPSYSAGSIGHVGVELGKRGYTSRWYPSVINARFVEVK